MTALHKHVKGGRFVINGDHLSIVFTSMKDLLTIIQPYFDKYTGGKYVSYLIFRKVIFALNDGYHKHIDVFLSIQNLCYFMHSTSTRTVESKHEISFERVVK